MSDLRPLDESQWLGFEEKLMGNSWGIAMDLIPKIRVKTYFHRLTCVFQTDAVKLIKLYSAIALYSTNPKRVTKQGLLLLFGELY